MKKLLIVIAFAVIATGANAQTGKAKPKAQTPVKKETVSKEAASQDYYTRQNGTIVFMKGGVAQTMKDDMIKFENGNYISKDGVLVFNNGTEKVWMEEGQRVDMKGNLQERGMEIKPVQDSPIQPTPLEVK